MGVFNITFDEQPISNATYRDYINTIVANCGDDNLQRPIVFDDTSTGAYNVGHIYTGGAGGQYLKILSYTDTALQHDVLAGVDEAIPGFVASQLYDIISGNPLTYPAVIAIINLGNIQTLYNGAEVICLDSSKYEYRRTRTIKYTIIDSNGTEGPVRYATFYLTAQPT